MRYLLAAIATAILWVACSFVYHTLWPSGPDAWTNGVDTTTWHRSLPEAPPRPQPAPRPKPDRKVLL